MARIGRFRVPGQLCRDIKKGEGLNIFRGMGVIETRHDFMADQMEYIAYHPDFRDASAAEIIPEYAARFDADSATPIWEEVKP